jgi:hypothetical protein
VLTGARVPWRRNPCGGECRWWHEGAAEGASMVDEGTHSVGTKLGVVLRGSERGQSGLLAGAQRWRARWRSGCEAGRGGRKGGAPWWGAPFIASRGGGTKAALR